MRFVEPPVARGAGARVAILDTGRDADHPDLAPNLNTLLSASFVDGEGFDEPGDDVWISAGEVSELLSWSLGTSMASPHVAGVAALVIGSRGGCVNPTQVGRLLRASSDDLGAPGVDAHYGFGRVNARRAVS